VAHVAWQYLVFIFIACCGVLQAAAAYSGLKGLMLIPRRLPSFVLGLALVVGAFIWFFSADNRAPPAGWPVLEGAQQVLVFGVAASLAVGSTALVTSLLRRRTDKQPNPRQEGLEALREQGYLQAVSRRWRRG